MATKGQLGPCWGQLWLCVCTAFSVPDHLDISPNGSRISMTHRPRSPSVHIRKRLVGGKPNGNCPEAECFGLADPGSHFHHGSLRHSSHHHFRVFFFFHCFALSRRDTTVAEGQLRILLAKRKETTVGFTRMPTSGFTEFHQKLFPESCSGAHYGKTGASVHCQGRDENWAQQNHFTSNSCDRLTVSAESRIVGFWGSAIRKPRLSFMWEHFGEEEMLRQQNPHPRPEHEQASPTFDLPIGFCLSALAGCIYPFSRCPSAGDGIVFIHLIL